MFISLLHNVLLVWCSLAVHWTVAEIDDNAKPYEFSFDIVDFQHRHEKKDADGIITGEYGFITADGVYHETAYATDKNGNFIITKTRNRKIKNLKDVEELFKDKPLAAKMLTDAMTRACSGCKLPESTNEVSPIPTQGNVTIPLNKINVATKEMIKTLLKSMNLDSGKVKDTNSSNKQSYNVTEKYRENKNSEKYKESKNDEKYENKNDEKYKENKNDEKYKENKNDEKYENKNNEKYKESKSDDKYKEGKNKENTDIIYSMVESAKKALSEFDEVADLNTKSSDALISDEALQKIANDLFYSFNYTITSHGHNENGYRDGRKDGSYNLKGQDGTDTWVKYLSNEFGHQPNITHVTNSESGNASNAETALKGYAFNWYRN